MEPVMSACGVLCSECAAYKGRERGAAHQQRAAEAWLRIYGYRQEPAQIDCGGCLSSDRDVFPTSRTCRARRCCRAKALAHCGECGVERCAALERAQSVWDGVPEIARTLSPADRAAHAAAYLGHRDRIARARAARRP
jgi:hypothetical protein